MAQYKQGYNDRLDESLGMRRGKESSMKQSFKDRRDESRGMSKSDRTRSRRDYGRMPKDLGHDSKTYACDWLGAEQSDLSRLSEIPNNNRGYPQKAWEYKY